MILKYLIFIFSYLGFFLKKLNLINIFLFCILKNIYKKKKLFFFFKIGCLNFSHDFCLLQSKDISQKSSIHSHTIPNFILKKINFQIKGMRLNEVFFKKRLSLIEGQKITLPELKTCLDLFSQKLIKKNLISNFSWKFKNGILDLSIQEAPLIRSIAIKGSKLAHKNEKDIHKIMRVYLRSFQVGLFYSPIMLEEASHLMGEFLMKDNTYNNISILPKVIPSDDGMFVDIHFFVEEGQVAYIRHVVFEGRKKMSLKRLRQALLFRALDQNGIPSDNNRLNPQKIHFTAQRIKKLYKKEGFLEVVVSPPRIEITKDLRDAYVTFPIQEGSRFFITKIIIDNKSSYSGSLVKKVFQDMEKLLKNEPASIEKIDQALHIAIQVLAKKNFFCIFEKKITPYSEKDVELHIQMIDSPGGIVGFLDTVQHRHLKTHMIRQDIPYEGAPLLSDEWRIVQDHWKEGTEFLKKFQLELLESKIPDENQKLRLYCPELVGFGTSLSMNLEGIRRSPTMELMIIDNNFNGLGERFSTSFTLSTRGFGIEGNWMTHQISLFDQPIGFGTTFSYGQEKNLSTIEIGKKSDTPVHSELETKLAPVDSALETKLAPVDSALETKEKKLTLGIFGFWNLNEFFSQKIGMDFLSIFDREKKGDFCPYIKNDFTENNINYFSFHHTLGWSYKFNKESYMGKRLNLNLKHKNIQTFSQNFLNLHRVDAAWKVIVKAKNRGLLENIWDFNMSFGNSRDFLNLYIKNRFQTITGLLYRQYIPYEDRLEMNAFFPSDIFGFETEGLSPRDALSKQSLKGTYLYKTGVYLPVNLFKTRKIMPFSFFQMGSLWKTGLIPLKETPIQGESFSLKTSAGFGIVLPLPGMGEIALGFGFPLKKDVHDKVCIIWLTTKAPF